MRLVGDVAAGYGDPISLVTAHSYDNSWYDSQGDTAWPYFRIPSVMGTGLLVHRATTLGLPILVGAILLLVAGLPTDERSAAPVIARCSSWRPACSAPAGAVPLLLLPAFGVVAVLYVVIGRRLLDAEAPRNAALLVAPFILAVPFAVAPLLNASGSGASSSTRLGVGTHGRWTGGRRLLLRHQPGGAVRAGHRGPVRPRPAKAFLGAWAVALFAIPNLMQVSDVAFDMNKYFQAMWIAVALLAAWFIRRWPWPAIALVLLLSVPSPLLVAGWTAFNREQVLDWNGVEAANWIAANTPTRRSSRPTAG